MLVVDDNPTARAILQRFLTALTFQVDTAASGSEALQLLCRQEQTAFSYAFILMDWLMPGLDGIETSRRIRAERLCTAPMVLLTTALGSEHVFRHAEAAGIRHFLMKPVQPSHLYHLVMKIFDLDTGENAHVLPVGQPVSLAPASILLVEDHEINQQMVCELLAKTGARMSVASNGMEAVAMVQASRFDLVLMDIQMPIMDGLAATRAIRTLDHANAVNLPIIAMTAHAMSGDRECSLAAGMNDHLVKPIEPAGLLCGVQRSLPRETHNGGQQAVPPAQVVPLDDPRCR